VRALSSIAADGTGAASRSHRLSRKAVSESQQRWAAAAFLLPDTLGLLIFVGVPIVLALSMGFFRVSGFGDYSFIGLSNYQRLFADDQFIQSMLRTGLFAIILVPSTYLCSLALALLMQREMPLRGIMRSLLFMPHVVSVVVVGTVWRFLLAGKVGVVNQAISSLGLEPQSWLGNPRLALLAVILICVWLEMGFYMIIFIAGLEEIPRDYYEAAKIDGANPWQRFWGITMPLLRPTSFFVIVVNIAAAIAGGQVVDLTIAMTSGGPAKSTTLATYYVYQQAFEIGDYGYAAAAASVVVLALVVLTAAFFWVTGGGRFTR
jgi:multiple sugar transport system permease protein